MADLNGLLIVNKPKGITSFDVIRRLRQLTGVRKIGHTGTLDPLASGVMLMLFGTATKRAGEYSQLDKTYRAEITLGSRSTTGDAEGDLTPVDDKHPDAHEVERALKSFVGTIEQTPSVYSAIKINGQEAYKRARRGESIDMPSRTVTIHTIKLNDYQYPIIKLEASVSSGTYIRSLAQDLGEALGTGAYLSALIRTRVGEYTLEQATSLEDSPKTIHSKLLTI